MRGRCDRQRRTEGAQRGTGNGLIDVTEGDRRLGSHRKTSRIPGADANRSQISKIVIAIFSEEQHGNLSLDTAIPVSGTGGRWNAVARKFIDPCVQFKGDCQGKYRFGALLLGRGEISPFIGRSDCT